VTSSETATSTALNCVCPYYTMYPLDFPLQILRRGAQAGQWVIDPFCGRGTTSFAARMVGLPSVGLDSSPVAVALAKAKLPMVSPRQVHSVARYLLASRKEPKDIPSGEFWRWAFHRQTLHQICRLREGLMEDCDNETRLVLRAILLGALHGPLTKGDPSYLSNQCPRTFAPKPDYAVRFWKHRHMRPKKVDALGVINRRAKRYLSNQPQIGLGSVKIADSRRKEAFDFGELFSWVITSPPYFGMRTYIPDQWLRNWFLGGPSDVVYKMHKGEIAHSSADHFVDQLATVWKNVAMSCKSDARMITRFGGINDRKQEPLELLKASLKGTGWKIMTIRDAGSARDGRRQADQFGGTQNSPRTEYDVYARLC
jgi:hypothetical protein